MSHVEPEAVHCPACGQQTEVQVFRSLNGELIPEQVQQILAGSFERVLCPACGAAFQPEHRMLYAHFPLRTWIVMQPPADQPRFTDHERGVTALFERRLREAPALIARGLHGVRPRLVYGQRFLAEAIRVAETGLDAALFECIKLLAVRRNLPRLFAHLPVELCYEGRAEDQQLQFGVHEGQSGERCDTLLLPGNAVDEVQAVLPTFAKEYPDLFAQPYVSATRYLFGPLPRS